MDAILPRTSALINSALLTSEEMPARSNVKATSAASPGIAIDKAAQQRLAETVADAASENFFNTSLTESAAPEIRQPAIKMTSKATALMLMAQCDELSSTLDTHKLNNALSTLIAVSEGKMNKAKAMAEEIDKLQEKFNSYHETEHAAAVSTEEEAQKNVAYAESRVKTAKNQLDNLLSRLGAQSADDPAVTENKEVAEAVKELNLAREALQAAKKNHENAKINLTKVTEILQSITNEINARADELNKEFSARLGEKNVYGDIVKKQQQTALTKTAIMIQLIVEFINKMDESSAEKMKSQAEINRKQLAARQKKMDEEGKEIRKKEELIAKMGFWARLLGVIMTVVGVATSFMGGGAVVAAIGISLLAGDMLLDKLTGKGLVEYLMDYVINPVIEKLSPALLTLFDFTVIGLILKAVEEITNVKIMDTVHDMVKATLAVAALLAMAMVAKSAIQHLTKQIMQSVTKSISNQVAKSMTNVISETIKKYAKVISKAASKAVRKMKNSIKNLKEKIFNTTDPAEVKRLSAIMQKRVEILNSLVMFTNAATSVGTNFAVAELQLQANKAIAQFKNAMTDADILRQMLSTIFDSFKKDQQDINSVNLLLSDTLLSKANSAKFVAHNIRA